MCQYITFEGTYWWRVALFRTINVIITGKSRVCLRLKLSVVANIVLRVARGLWYLTTGSDGNHFSNSRTQLGSVKSQSNKREKNWVTWNKVHQQRSHSKFSQCLTYLPVQREARSKVLHLTPNPNDKTCVYVLNNWWRF